VTAVINVRRRVKQLPKEWECIFARKLTNAWKEWTGEISPLDVSRWSEGGKRRQIH
jgi:hypothetical protein